MGITLARIIPDLAVIVALIWESNRPDVEAGGTGPIYRLGPDC